MTSTRRARRAGLLLAAGLAMIGSPSALAYEWDIAKPGKPPRGLPCVKATGATACFQHRGDRFWVKDTMPDAMSAIAKWELNHNAATQGYCRNRLKAGRWGYCDKAFHEGALVGWWAARYDRDTNKFHGPWSAGKRLWANGARSR